MLNSNCFILLIRETSGTSAKSELDSKLKFYVKLGHNMYIFCQQTDACLDSIIKKKERKYYKNNWLRRKNLNSTLKNWTGI
jgi:hypothetical protein